MTTKSLVALAQLRRETAEEAEQRPLDLGLIRRLFSFTKAHSRKRNWLLALVVLRAVQLPMLAWAIGAVINGPVARHDERGLWWAAFGFLGLAALTQFSFHHRQRLALELGEAVVHDLRNEIFRHLQRMPMSFYNRTRLGRMISRMTSDAEAVRVGVQDVLFVSLVQGGQMLVAAAMMLYYDPVLFAVMLVMAPMLWMLTRHFRQKLSKANREIQESFSRVTAALVESVTGIRITQGFTRQDVNAGFFRALVTDHSKYNLGIARASGVFLPLLELNSQFFMAALLVIGGWRALHGADTNEVANLIRFFFLAGMFFGPIQVIGNQYNQALTAMAGAERVFQLLDTAPDWEDPAGAMELPAIRGRVEFRDVAFSYRPDRPALRGVSFIVEPGQTVALVGPTGSGKSTIINLLTKFYLPDAGQVLIDGYDVRNVSGDSLHRQMGIVGQQNFLFTGTVMDNVLVGRPSATEPKVIEAARALGCLDLIGSLPAGFATQVGERGSALSLGQRQLVCFLRAMVADPRILILDEATSSVDAMTEARLRQALEALLRGRTSFVVAHRLSTVRNADLVLVLDHGRIVERGTHQSLLGQGGAYAALYRQFALSAAP
jgi:ATP-binding cassette subfamily B protein